jgi:hypothetical protein
MSTSALGHFRPCHLTVIVRAGPDQTESGLLEMAVTMFSVFGQRHVCFD